MITRFSHYLFQISLSKSKAACSRSSRGTTYSKSRAQVRFLCNLNNFIVTDLPEDIVERFTLTMMLFAVAFRNLIELSGSTYDLSDVPILPKSFGWFKGGSLLWTISYVCVDFHDLENRRRPVVCTTHSPL